MARSGPDRDSQAPMFVDPAGGTVAAVGLYPVLDARVQYRDAMVLVGETEHAYRQECADAPMGPPVNRATNPGPPQKLMYHHRCGCSEDNAAAPAVSANTSA
ncbi:unnamed protein product [Candidula unifasciata]|uniref:Uncharacterized protein n=1 Tax=Candidula unifasciata TaxID=100452 RepID=A0A8S3ZIR7_9EUPU|nr:unnamed protein product [Candidula unifasciata]